MDIGIPKEVRDLDRRVAIGVNSVAELVKAGHKVYVETGAGDGAGFYDEQYIEAGATIVYSTEEAYKRAQLVCKVATPSLEELDEMLPEQILCCFAHLAAASPQRFQKVLDKRITVLAYEMLRDGTGQRPLLRTMSEIAGRLVPQVAAQLLQSPQGRGLLLAGIPGLPPAEVCIIGAGEVGFNAARAFAGLGAQVTVLDEAQRLSDLDRVFDVPGRIRLMYAYPDQLAMAAAFSDVLVGAILRPGERTPHVVTEEMVRGMRPGAAIIDVSIDQGGCVATSRPTTLRDPVFVDHGVLHYCVPNFTALVARTASRALSNVLRPYLVRHAGGGLETLSADSELRSALMVYRGHVVDPRLASAQGVELSRFEEVS
ncbi:MAG: alanine dehydrogenase [Deltaproteobacteria bacterium]|jgi:alanine dehydrogenase|nr:alanine dehydrogenase [Deltaproteobacteria bacterium]MBW2537550.1 alanine dehydrogenase [Deltaproteobacteria bacterium]